jgi:ketosteroid isomerase-like protein
MRVAVAFLASVGLLASSACNTPSRNEVPVPNTPSVEADLLAIEALNKHDVKAAMESDIDAVTTQWSEDFVVLPPVGPIIRGRSANVEGAERGRELLKAFETVEHAVDFEEIKVLGDYAYEWGTFRGRSRPRAGGEAVSYSGKIMRILQRQSDGTWKMHRTMTTSDPPAK